MARYWDQQVCIIVELIQSIISKEFWVAIGASKPITTTVSLQYRDTEQKFERGVFSKRWSTPYCTALPALMARLWCVYFWLKHLTQCFATSFVRNFLEACVSDVPDPIPDLLASVLATDWCAHRLGSQQRF